MTEPVGKTLPAPFSLDPWLLPWFERARRDLPWRGTRDPYHIWVSEVMLQQTRVDTVIPYYHRFIARFPSMAEFAKAPLDDVLKMWEGLGYYARARNFHRAVKTLVAEGRGVPDALDAMLALPGVGRYTAGAVLSIAFDRRLPVLDGNVIRVLTRLTAEPADVRQTATVERLWMLAERLVGEHASLHNQALMELGATVCKPHEPACGACPLETLCAARARGRSTEYPRKSKRAPLPHHDAAVAVVRDPQGRLLLARRAARGLLGGLWEFPGDRPREGETLHHACARGTLEGAGVRIRVGRALTTVKHAFTHFKLTLHAFDAEEIPGDAAARGGVYDEVRWVAPDELERHALPRAHRRILEGVS